METTMSFYAKKLIFNITQTDLDRMTAMRLKHGLQQSEYIRRAIRVYVAEHTIQEMNRESGTDFLACTRPRTRGGIGEGSGG